MSGKWKKKASIKGLCLTRKEGDKVVVNKGELIIEIVELRGKAVRIAFQGSKEILIERAEVKDETYEEDLSFDGTDSTS